MAIIYALFFICVAITAACIYGMIALFIEFQAECFARKPTAAPDDFLTEESTETDIEPSDDTAAADEPDKYGPHEFGEWQYRPKTIMGAVYVRTCPCGAYETVHSMLELAKPDPQVFFFSPHPNCSSLKCRSNPLPK